MNKNAIEYYKSFSEAVKEFCLPLNYCFGISFFGYAKIYNNGKYLLITNDKDFNSYYIKNITSTNIFFKKYISSKTCFESIFWPSEPINLSMQACYDFNHWHGMTFVLNKTDDYIEVGSFAVDRNNPQIYEFYCRNSHVLEKFVIKFKERFSEQIDILPNDKRHAKFIEKVDIYVPERKILDEQKAIEQFYREIGITYGIAEAKNFTSTELKILKFISLGYTAKLTALELGVSPRTIESHLQKIKQKTDTNYKNDLVNIANQIFY